MEQILINVPRVANPPMDIEKETELALALDLFLLRRISVEKAAEIAGLHYYDFLIELRRRGIKAFTYEDEEAKKELLPEGSS